MEAKKRYKLYIIAFALIIVLSFIYKLLFKGDLSGCASNETTDDTLESTVETQTIEAVEMSSVTQESQASIISVYICGAVYSPGVYELPSGSIVNDVVVLAGGMTSEAATTVINLAYVLEENMSIYIPNASENAFVPEVNSSELYRSSDVYVWGTDYSDSNTSQQQSSGLININTASREELMTLPGIGEVYADAIISYRTETPFLNIEDLMNVSGIGESRFNNLANLICV